MKFHSIAEELFSSKIKIALLKMLLRYYPKKFSGRELARLLNSSPSSVLGALELFRRYGLAHKTRIGKTAEWVINKQHLLAGKLRPLISLDGEAISILRQKVKKEFQGNKGIKKVILFGSLAKAEERPESDIDLFILTDENKKEAQSQIDKLNGLFMAYFGNSISPIIYSSKEFAAKKDSLLIKHIKEEGETILSNE